MGPDDESVIHITKPAERLMGCLVERHLLKVLHEEFGDNRRQWQTHSQAVGLYV
jgi:hypothetical protein